MPKNMILEIISLKCVINEIGMVFTYENDVKVAMLKM